MINWKVRLKNKAFLVAFIPTGLSDSKQAMMYQEPKK